jgi:uncharacterized protein
VTLLHLWQSLPLESVDIYLILAVTLGAACAGFTDAVVGGGGLIQVPLLFILFPSLSHVQVIATNRFASIFGTTLAASQYAKTIGLAWESIIPAGIAAAVGSFSGTFIMATIPVSIFKPVLLVIIIGLTLYTFLNKNFGLSHKDANRPPVSWLRMAAIGLGIGLYNGIIGPGTGVLLVFSMVSLVGWGFLQGSAVSKAINAIADAASLIGFILSQAIVYKLAIPMLFGNMAGSYIGSHLAISKGNSFVRYFFLIIVSVLILRLAWDIFISTS